MVKLGRVSRSGFYRFDDADPGPDADMDLRDAIQKIAVEWPAYGRPRVTHELRERSLPRQLNRMTATVNGKSAYIYYISPTQLNVLTPPDALSGTVQVQVTNNGATSAPFTAPTQLAACDGVGGDQPLSGYQPDFSAPGGALVFELGKAIGHNRSRFPLDHPLECIGRGVGRFGNLRAPAC